MADCISPACIINELEFLVDTGSEVNVIKIDVLRNGLTIDDTQKIYLKRISNNTIQTLGKITIPLIIQGQEISTEFNLVDRNFSIRKHGIIGNSFLTGNNSIIDLANKTLAIKINVDNRNIILKPRTETIVPIPIAAKDVENKDIFIHRQEIKEAVFCGSIVNTVQNSEVVISMLNITEEPQNIWEDELNKIQYDREFDYNFNQSGHMNDEQRQSIIEICEQFQDIFHLKRDILTHTNTMTHKINLQKNQPPIYRRLYRLHHSQMEEIDTQIKQMEKDDIIEPFFSPWNAPLLLVKKKLDASQEEKFRIVVDFRA
ncbi:Reverse transcriptase domain-containing protein, partial [Aphis craccivora]